MKRAVIIHCWEGVPEYCWYPWLKRALEAKGIHAEVPAMPETELPKQSLWVPKMHEVIGSPDEELVLVGHSVGCITILRYLESLKEGQRIAGAVLVAGFTDDLGFDELKNYFEEPIDFAKIRTHCPLFIAIHSDNDPFVELAQADTLKNKLGAEIIIRQNMGHFSGPVDDEESCQALPDALDAVLRLFSA